MPTFPNGGLKSVLRGYLNDTGLRKNNFSNSRAPLTSDNASQGYEIGSLWTYNNQLYVLTSIAGSTATWTANAGPQGPQGEPGQDASSTIQVLTQAEYDALAEYDPNVTYLIINEE